MRDTLSRTLALVLGGVQIGLAGLYCGYDYALSERSAFKVADLSVHSFLGLLTFGIGLLLFAFFLINKNLSGLYARSFGVLALLLPLLLYWPVFLEKRMLFVDGRFGEMLQDVSVVEAATFVVLCLLLVHESVSLIIGLKQNASKQDFSIRNSGQA